MSQAAIESVVQAVCEGFGLERPELADRRGQKTPRSVRFARGACGLLAHIAAAASISAMGRAIGYEGKYMLTLTRKHRTLLRWASWPKPPRKSGAVEFREKLQTVCHRLGVDIEDLVKDP
ncbi:MAG: hypothetical protein V3T83_02905 [Acidobacteriota bacterium]